MKDNSNEVLQLLPTAIVNSKNFTPKNKFLLATLLFLNGLDKVKSDGYFFRTNLMLAKEANIAEKNLLINLRKLEQMNFIIRKAGRRGEASEYIINEEIIFSYIDSKVSDKSSKVSNKLDSKVSDKSSKVSNKIDSKVSDKSSKVSNKVSDKVSNDSSKVSNEMIDKVSNNKVSNDSDKVSNKLDNIILRMSVLEGLLQQFISTYNSDKVSNEINAKVSTDSDTESESDTDSDIEKDNIFNNINKKDNILNNISNNILEKNLLEKVSERMKDKNSDKECSVETPHSNESNIVECIPSKSFLFSLVGEEDKTSNTVESNSMKEEVSNKECSVETPHSNEEPKSFPFSSLEDEANSIDINNSDTSTEMPLSSPGLRDNTEDEQSINSMEKTQENGLKEEILPMKEKEDKKIKECAVSTEHSNGDKFYNDFAFFVEELEEEERKANSIDANNNTPTEMPLSSARLKDNSSGKEDATEILKVQQSEAKERVVKSAEVLIEKLTKILSKEELISKATLYVEWLEKQKDTLNCEELFLSLMGKGSEAFGATHDRICEKESKKDVVVDIAIESFEEEKIDEVVSDFFGGSSVERTHVETEEKKEEEAIIRIISTGELITVEEAMKRGSALGNDIEDITSLRCNTRRRKTDYSYHFQW